MNNKSTVLKYFFNPFNTEKVSHTYKSEFNKTREKLVILLITTDDQKQYYVCVKNLNSLLKRKRKCSEYYCLTCFKKFRRKPNLENHKIIC